MCGSSFPRVRPTTRCGRRAYWQHTYQLAQPRLLPKGTTIEVVATFDNSPGNKFNPDPTKDVRWGDQTWEEMMIGFFGAVADRAVGRAVP